MRSYFGDTTLVWIFYECGFELAREALSRLRFAG